jgi:hypothetical protein
MKQVKEGLSKLGFAIRGGLPMVMLYASNLVAHAKEGDYDFSWIETSDNAAFDDLTQTVKETGGSAYKLVMAIGVVGVLLSIVISGLCIALGRNANKRSENITTLLYVGIGGIVIFGAMAILGILQSIGGNL